MVVAVALVRRVLVDADVPLGALFLAELITGAFVYLSMCSWRAKDLVADVRAFRRGRAEPAPAAPER
jgi:hypothetical protein